MPADRRLLGAGKSVRTTQVGVSLVGAVADCALEVPEATASASRPCHRDVSPGLEAPRSLPGSGVIHRLEDAAVALMNAEARKYTNGTGGWRAERSRNSLMKPWNDTSAISGCRK